jgi:hypothetical protein
MPDSTRPGPEGRSNRSLLALAAGLVAVAAVGRWVPHPPNFAPIGAMALFGGAVLGRPLFAFGVPLLALALSDLLLNAWYLGTPFVTPDIFIYGSFMLIGCLGTMLRRRSPLALAAGSLAGSVIFFALTNFGVWARGGLYPRTLEGLATSYTMAIPFFRNTVLGDLAWNAALFGAWGLLARKWAVTHSRASEA